MMPEMTADQRTAWRNVLMAEVTATTAPPSRRRGLVMSALGTAAVAAVAVVAVISAGPAPQAGPPRSQLMLNAAAQIVAADPIPGPGQYLLVRTRAEYLGADGTGNGYLSTELHETFLPADGSRPTIKRITYVKPTVFFGPGGTALAARDWAAVAPYDALDQPKTVVESENPAPAPEPLPLDPGQLIERLRTHENPAQLPINDFLFEQLAELAHRPGSTADLRATVYRALAQVPGIDVAEKTVVLDGMTGTAFALKDAGFDSTKQIVIDPGSGRYLGQRVVLNRADGAIPAGTLLESTAATTSIVSDAPRPTITTTPPAQLPRR
jgi:hypothetical protein